MKKKVITTALSASMFFSSVGNTFAASYDLHNKTSNEIISFWDFRDNVKSHFKVADNMDDYFMESAEGKFYKTSEVDRKLKNGAKTFNEAIVGLTPYLKTNSGLGKDLIDSCEILPESDASKYTETSWNNYNTVLESLKSLKSKRFVKEKDLKEAVEAYKSSYNELKKKTNINTRELEELIEESKSVDLEKYTETTANAYKDSITVGKNLLTEENVTQDSVDAAVENIKKAYKDLEGTSQLQIVSIMEPAAITVKAGSEPVLLASVYAKMSDNSHEEFKVDWQTPSDLEQPGKHEVKGTVEGKEVTQIINVVEESEVNKDELANAINKANSFSENKYSEPSYRELAEALEAGNSVNDKNESSQDEIDNAKEAIISAIENLKEEKPSDRIIYVVNPDDVVVSINGTVTLPEKVEVVLNSGIKLKKEVKWDVESVDTSYAGKQTIKGRVEGTDLRPKFNVEVKAEKTVDKTELNEMIKKGDTRVSDSSKNYTKASYNALVESLDKARKVSADTKATDSEVFRATEKLRFAIENLKEKLNVSEITNLMPKTDQNVKFGDVVTISFNAKSGGEAGYTIALPESKIGSKIKPNMKETVIDKEKSISKYEAQWVVPDGYNGNGMQVFVSFKAKGEKERYEVAEGKINLAKNLTVRFERENSPAVEESVRLSETPANVPESDKENYRIDYWTIKGSDKKVERPGAEKVYKNVTYVAHYKRMDERYTTVTFTLPANIKFKEGQKTVYEVLKSKTMAEQGVVRPEVDETTVPVGKKLDWSKIDLTKKAENPKEFTPELVVDEAQYETITISAGEHGSLKADDNTVKVLKKDTEENKKKAIMEKVTPDQYYVIGNVTITGQQAKVDFKEDSSKWVDIIFYNGENEIEKKHVHIDQTFENAGIKKTPEIANVPEGQKVVWTPEFNEKEVINGAKKYYAKLVEDESQYIVYKVNVNKNGKLIDENNKNFKLLKRLDDNAVKEEVKKIVKADDNYIVKNISINREGTPSINVEFAKDPNKWTDIKIVSGENGQIKQDGAQKSEIKLNVLLDKTLDDVLKSEKITFEASRGYKFNKWLNGETTVEPTQKISKNATYKADFIVDEDQYATVTFKKASGDEGTNGKLEGIESKKVLKGTKWSEVQVPVATANKGYAVEWNTDNKKLPEANSAITENKDYEVSFVKITSMWHSITFDAGEHGELVAGENKREVKINNLLEGSEFTNLPEIKAADGYKLIGWKLENSETQVKDKLKVANEDVKYIAQYEPRHDMSYTVKYIQVDSAGDRVLNGYNKPVEITNSNIVTGKDYDTVISISAANLPGFDIVGSNKQTIKLNKDNIVVEFKYKPTPEAYKAAKDEMAGQIKTQINGIGEIDDNLSVAYDETNKTIDFVFNNPNAVVLESVFNVFSKDDLFEALANITDMEKATFLKAGEKNSEASVQFNNEDGSRKASGVLVGELKQNLPAIVVAFGIDIDEVLQNMSTITASTFVGKEANIPVLGNTGDKLNNKVGVAFNDSYKFLFKVADRKIELLSEGKGRFNGKDSDEKTVKYNGKIGETPEFTPNPGYKLTGYTVEYKEAVKANNKVTENTVSKTVKPEELKDVTAVNNITVKPVTEKDASKFITYNIELGANGEYKNPSDKTAEFLRTESDEDVKDAIKGKVKAASHYQIKEVVLDKNTSKATVNFEKISADWVDVTFKLPAGVKFADETTEKKENILKNVAFKDQGVSVLELKPGTVPEGYDLIWPITENEKISENKVYTAELKKDASKFITYNIELGEGKEQGKFVSETDKTVEFLKSKSDEDVKNAIKAKVKANEHYQIKDVVLDKAESKATVNFEKNPADWADVTFKLPAGVKFADETTEKKENILKNVAFKDQGVSVPELKPGTVPEGYDLIWSIIENEKISENKVYTAELKKDASKFITYNIELGEGKEHGKFVSETDKTVEFLKSKSDEDVKKVIKGKVEAKAHYQIKDVVLDKVESKATVSFEKNPADWVDVAFKLPAGVQFADKTEIQKENLLKGQSLKQQKISIKEVKKDTVPEGKKVVWDVNFEENLTGNIEYIGKLEKDESQYITYNIVLGEGKENGQYVSETDKTAEFLRTKSEPEKITGIKAKVAAREHYQVKNVVLTEIGTPTATVNFEKNPADWSTITLKLPENVKFKGDDKTERHIDVLKEKTLDEQNFSIPEVDASTIPEGYVLKWNINKETKESEDKVYTAELKKDMNKWVTVKFAAGEGGEITGTTNYEKLRGKNFTSAGITLPGITPSRGYKFVKWNPEIPDTTPNEKEVTYTALFTEDENQHAIITFEVGEGRQFGKLNGTLSQNVIKGDKWSQITVPGFKDVRRGYKGVWRETFPNNTDAIEATKTYTVDFVKNTDDWADVTFKLPEGVKFADGNTEKKENILKNVAFKDQGVSVPEVNPSTVPEGYNLTWSITENEKISENKIYTAELKKDASKFITYNIELGANGEYKNPSDKTAEFLRTKSDEDVKKVIKGKVQAKEHYQIKDVVLDKVASKATVNFEKNPADWVDVTFKLPAGVQFADKTEIQKENLLKGQSLKQQKISIKEIKKDTVPEGKKVVWDVNFEENLTGNIEYTGKLEKDESQYITYNIVLGEGKEHGKYANETEKTAEFLRTKSEAEKITGVKAKVAAFKHYQVKNVILTEGETPTATVSFEKNPADWADVTFKLPNGAKFTDKTDKFTRNILKSETIGNQLQIPKIDSGTIPTGYDFKGWKLSNSEEIKTTEKLKSEKVSAPSAEYTAVFEPQKDKKYTIKMVQVNKNGEKITNNGFVIKTEEKTGQTYDADVTVSAPTLKNFDVYTENGEKSEKDIKISSENQVVEFKYVLKADVENSIKDKIKADMNAVITEVNKSADVKAAIDENNNIVFNFEKPEEQSEGLLKEKVLPVIYKVKAVNNITIGKDTFSTSGKDENALKTEVEAKLDNVYANLTPEKVEKTSTIGELHKHKLPVKFEGMQKNGENIYITAGYNTEFKITDRTITIKDSEDTTTTPNVIKREYGEKFGALSGVKIDEGYQVSKYIVKNSKGELVDGKEGYGTSDLSKLNVKDNLSLEIETERKANANWNTVTFNTYGLADVFRPHKKTGELVNANPTYVLNEHKIGFEPTVRTKDLKDKFVGWRTDGGEKNNINEEVVYSKPVYDAIFERKAKVKIYLEGNEQKNLEKDIVLRTDKGGSYTLTKKDFDANNLGKLIPNSEIDPNHKIPVKATLENGVLTARLYLNGPSDGDYDIGDEHVGDVHSDGFYIVNRKYTKNTENKDEIGKVEIKDIKNNKVVTDDYNFKYYDKKGGNPITEFDLSKGGSTFTAYMVATSKTGDKKFEGNVVFKYGSVTIGDNDEYMTIEDALNRTKNISGNKIIVKHNTSFADSEISKKVYGTNEFTVAKGNELLIPFDSKYSSNTKTNLGDSMKQNEHLLKRGSEFSKLNLTANTKIDIFGKLTVNAITNGGTTYGSGYVTDGNYGMLETGKNSAINVENGGELYSIGFIIGNGKINGKVGSKIVDVMMMHDFRGGKSTLANYQEVFPFDQFSVNNIETDLRIESGAKYIAMTHVTVGGQKLFFITLPIEHEMSDIDIIGGNESLFDLQSGYIEKKYDINSGKNIWNIYGNAKLNNVTMTVKGTQIETKGKEIPFCGLHRINVKSGSKIETDLGIKILPGAELNVEKGATAQVNKGSRLFVYGPNNYDPGDYGGYLKSGYSRKYRIAPKNLGFDKTTGGKVNVDGILILNGKAAGEITCSDKNNVKDLREDKGDLTIKHLPYCHDTKDDDKALKTVTSKLQIVEKKN